MHLLLIRKHLLRRGPLAELDDVAVRVAEEDLPIAVGGKHVLDEFHAVRRELGEQPSREEYFRRFPSLRPELEKLFAVDSAVATDTVADHSNEAREVMPPNERGDAGPVDDASSAMRFT